MSYHACTTSQSLRWELTVFYLCGPSSQLTPLSHCYTWLCWRNSDRSSGRRNPKRICIHRRIRQRETRALAATSTLLLLSGKRPKTHDLGCPLKAARLDTGPYLSATDCYRSTRRRESQSPDAQLVTKWMMSPKNPFELYSIWYSQQNEIQRVRSDSTVIVNLFIFAPTLLGSSL